MSNTRIKILGISFFKGEIEDVFSFLINQGGLMTVPAAPNLAMIESDSHYYNALLNSDIVIADSGYMVLIWNFISCKKITRLSGLAFINFFLKNISELKDKDFFLVNPSEKEGELNMRFLESKGLKIRPENMYTAPIYKDQFSDEVLFNSIEKQKPDWILINIGGGVQEKIGFYLKQNLSYSPAIICTGAAIAFKTGVQVSIPSWIDKLFLGWLVRIISNPKTYYGRYFKAFSLIGLIIKYKSRMVKTTNQYFEK